MSESIVELRPGQKINIVCKGVVLTDFGEREQETIHTTTYEEILAKFRAQPRAKRVLNINQEAREFSKQCTLLGQVLQTGKWRTGADADQNQVVNKLITRFNTLKPESLKDIAEKSIKALGDMTEVKTLKPEHKKVLMDAATKIKTAKTAR